MARQKEKPGAAKAGRLLQAKKRAISLLDRCLSAHNLDIQEHEEILMGTYFHYSGFVCVFVGEECSLPSLSSL